MSLHFGGNDRWVPNDEVDAIKTKVPHATGSSVFHLYDGAAHGFAQSDSAAYDAAVTQLAEERALTMLAGIV